MNEGSWIDIGLLATGLLFALLGWFCTLILIVKADLKTSTQLTGSVLVVAIALLANNVFVYSVSVFIIATLVTELEFLEKLAALAWNRKEYWQYLLGKASQEEQEKKVEAEVNEVLDEYNEDEDEAEPVDDDETPIDTASGIESLLSEDRLSLLSSAREFETEVRENLKRTLPDTLILREEVALRVPGARRFIIDLVIESEHTHYIIEIKYYKRPSSLVNAVHQISNYVEAYREYLRERRETKTIQPILIVPHNLNIGNSFRGIPITTFDTANKIFTNLNIDGASRRESYSETGSSLSSLLDSFLSRFSRWAFSPTRISVWGSKQSGFEDLRLFSKAEIREELERMLSRGLVETRQSKKGNRLYIISNREGVND